jgi:heme exporter protein A
MLQAVSLSCQRGGRYLFKDVSFHLQPGAWLRVAGDNGSGKTSLLRLITGLSPTEDGQVLWNQLPLQAGRAAFHQNLLYLGHHNAVKDDLTPLENLQFAARLCQQPITPNTALLALQRMGLKSRAHVLVRHLSAGQQRRVLLARLLTQQAKLWVLDEPFTALDVSAVALLTQLLQDHLALGGMAVLTSHQALQLPAGQEVML